jgi:hypothetical protein
VVWWQALPDEAWPEDRSESPSDVVAECKTDSTSTGVRNPVALSCESAAGDGVSELFEAGVGGECFSRNRLN